MDSRVPPRFTFAPVVETVFPDITQESNEEERDAAKGSATYSCKP